MSTRIHAIVLSLLLIALISPASASDTYIIHVEKDAYVDSDNPTTNYGTYDMLDCRQNFLFSYYRRTFLTFNLTMFNFTVEEATLYLYCYSIPESGYNVSANELSNDTWGEDSITWDNQPSYDNQIGSWVICNGVDKWESWNVTNYVQSEYEGDRVVSLVLKMPEDKMAGKWVRFRSREYGCTYCPYLNITYSAGTRDGVDFESPFLMGVVLASIILLALGLAYASRRRR